MKHPWYLGDDLQQSSPIQPIPQPVQETPEKPPVEEVKPVDTFTTPVSFHFFILFLDRYCLFTCKFRNSKSSLSFLSNSIKLSTHYRDYHSITTFSDIC